MTIRFLFGYYGLPRLRLAMTNQIADYRCQMSDEKTLKLHHLQSVICRLLYNLLSRKRHLFYYLLFFLYSLNKNFLTSVRQNDNITRQSLRATIVAW